MPAEEVRGPASGRAQEGRPEDEPRNEVSGFPPHWKPALTVSPGRFGNSTSRTLCRASLLQNGARAQYSLPLSAKLAAEINRVIPGWILAHKLEVALLGYWAYRPVLAFRSSPLQGVIS
jgi:hypothetical protein